MKVSTKLCFCMVLPFFVLLVCETFAKVPNILKICGRKKDGTTNVQKNEIIQTKKGYFNQKLDHFDSTNTITFKQIYYFYEGNYVIGNPVYLLVGGICELHECSVQKTVWINFVKDTNALFIALEHRMYGESYPNEWDFSTTNLQYLNSKQALADLEFFIDTIVDDRTTGFTISRHATWMALGSHYGGTLAALLRKKIPDKIKAAMAFDAPLLPTVGFEGFFNFLENQCKKETVDVTLSESFDDLNKSFDACETEENKLKCVEDIFSSHQKTFNFCKGSPSKNYDVNDYKTFLFWSLTTILARAFEFGDESQQKLKGDVISNLLDEKLIPNALERLGSAVKLVLQSLNVECLIVDYKSLIDIYKDTSPKAKYNDLLLTGLGNRQNVYQRCSEWGQFKTASKTDGIFANLIPIEFYVNICIRIFGSEFNREFLENAIQKTLLSYGGQTINVSKVLFLKRNSDFSTDIGFPSTKLLSEVTEQDSIGIMIVVEDRAFNVSRWKLIRDRLKNWLALADIARENNTGRNRGRKSEQSTNVVPSAKIEDEDTVSDYSVTV